MKCPGRRERVEQTVERESSCETTRARSFSYTFLSGFKCQNLVEEELLMALVRSPLMFKRYRYVPLSPSHTFSLC